MTTIVIRSATLVVGDDGLAQLLGETRKRDVEFRWRREPEAAPMPDIRARRPRDWEQRAYRRHRRGR